MGTLENVKVGDKLVTTNNYGESIEIVERITETLVITKYYRYGKKDGYAKGMDRYSYRKAKPATPEDINRIADRSYREHLVNACKNIKFSQLTNSQLDAIVRIAEGK